MPISSHFRHLRRNACVAAVFVLASSAVLADEAAPAGETARVTTLVMPLEFAHRTSGFATRRHPIRKTMHFHAGIDFAAPHGTPVRSVDAGTVEFAGTRNGYGKVVHIRHDGERTTVYAHLSRIDVRVGDIVRQGDAIGAVGSSGLATGPHLHFEVRERGRPVDPLKLAYTPTVARATVASAARCLELLTKASLEALAPNEVEILREGCVE